MQITTILYNYSQYNIVIAFLIKASEERDKGENVKVNGDAAASCLKSRF
jgi:hypothetical protein